MRTYLDISCADQVTLIKVNARELDHANIDKISAELLGLAKCVPGSRLHLDLRRVHFVASAALGLIVRLHKQVRAAGGVLVLDNLNPIVCDALRRACLDRLVAVQPAPESDITLPLSNAVA